MNFNEPSEEEMNTFYAEIYGPKESVSMTMKFWMLVWGCVYIILYIA